MSYSERRAKDSIFPELVGSIVHLPCRGKKRRPEKSEKSEKSEKIGILGIALPMSFRAEGKQITLDKLYLAEIIKD
jgi:hypothetical protein